ncbi:MAG: hypothetical protein K8S25_01450 [Alphaproteobacteria bacterium]|nr:hypothetical protein [Alphaproteobacteria bacterium]
MVFAITNTSDRCTLIFSDLLGTKVGDEQVRPVFTAIRMEALDGTLLSGTDAMGEWYTSYLPFYAPFVDDQSYTFKFERLAAGAVRVKRWTIGQMLEFLEWQRLREKRSALPWGTTVVMQIKVTVHIDERAAAGIVDETPLKKVDAVSAKFLVLLPTLPAEGDVAR